MRPSGGPGIATPSPSTVGALADARRPAGAAPPPRAAEFVLAAIESTAIGALGRHDGGEFVARIPDLAALAGAIFLDDTTALGG